MTRLIDADARVTVQSFDIEHEEYKQTEMSVEEALDFATEEGCPQTVDAVPVVRCRDCKYSDVIYDTTLDTMPLKCLNIRYGGVQPEWYCEHGERRDEHAAD